LSKYGFYINDLSLYDYSRELVVVGSQQQAELKLALDQQRSKSKALTDSMKKLDDQKRTADELLLRLLPKKVAESLRDGTPLINLCESFSQCTILFSDVVEFTSTCSKLSPIEVISLLNEMYTRFDGCLEKFNCYKVETIGDAYMIVSGVPERNNNHALEIVNMGFSMLEEIDQILNPVTQENMKIRIGCHSGPVVAGIVGLKMPRYCLFGDTVQIANKMEATGQIMRIHVSEKTKSLLNPTMFEFKERGKLETAIGGELNTFIIEGKHDGKQMQYPFSKISSVEFDKKDHGAKWEGFKLNS
jgi:guanylate cyclase, other